MAKYTTAIRYTWRLLLSGGLLLTMGVPAGAWPWDPPPKEACQAWPEVMQHWQVLRHSWYQELPASTNHLGLLEDFARAPAQQAALKAFYKEHGAAMGAHRQCFMEQLPHTKPDLSRYQVLPWKADTARMRPQQDMLAMLTPQPLSLMYFVQSLLLGQHLTAKEMASFYTRQAVAQPLYASEVLTEGGSGFAWRLWMNSYDYIFAVDLPLLPTTFRLHGVWKRQTTVDKIDHK